MQYLTFCLGWFLSIGIYALMLRTYANATISLKNDNHKHKYTLILHMVSGEIKEFPLYSNSRGHSLQTVRQWLYNKKLKAYALEENGEDVLVLMNSIESMALKKDT